MSAERCRRLPVTVLVAALLIMLHDFWCCCESCPTGSPATSTSLQSKTAVLAFHESRYVARTAGASYGRPLCKQGKQVQVGQPFTRRHRQHTGGRETGKAGSTPVPGTMRVSDDNENANGILDRPETAAQRMFGSAGLTRQQLVLGSWSAALCVAYVGATQEQRSYQTRKRDLFRSISGEDKKEFREILEVGIGGNPGLGGFSNLQFYRPGQDIVGVDPALSDPNSQAVEEATARAEAKGVRLRAMGGVAEELPFETGSFDAVVSTLVFCSVRNPSAALREVSRVLRPGGKFVFVEHIFAPEEGLSLLGLRKQQELLDPLQQKLAAGCHLTRQTDRLIRDSVSGEASFSASDGKLFSRLESMENVRVSSMWPVSEQVFGVAVK